MTTFGHSLNVAFLAVVLGSGPLFAQSHPPRFGLGVNYGGAQLDWRPSQKWMFEARAQTGSDQGTSGTSHSTVVGTRAYRFLGRERLVVPLMGLQLAIVQTDQDNSTYKASGPSAGLFAGLAFKLNNHLRLLIDMGPYVIALSEKRTHADTTEVDLVADAAVIVFF